jgi:hypothetical protein
LLLKRNTKDAARAEMRGPRNTNEWESGTAECREAQSRDGEGETTIFPDVDWVALIFI